MYLYKMVCFKNVYNAEISYRGVLRFIIGPMLLFGHYIDLTKDTILAIRLVFLLGGLTPIFTYFDKFSSMVSSTNKIIAISSNQGTI